MLRRIAMRFEKKCGTISTLLQAARAQLAAMEEEAAEAEAERAAVEEDERQEEEDDAEQQQREGSGDEDESENDGDDEDAHEGATGTDIGGHAAEEDDSDSGGEVSPPSNRPHSVNVEDDDEQRYSTTRLGCYPNRVEL
ncbi:hypothetical protein B0H17DRAFT_1148715 [Mycena rosella]|uniref:Uncharacterized protein n=1 Tax=Mycena rosella TaxID=1033263 RepID=A0AAD7C9I0_MYCRO|nr:hypothetical protein B0H17DRAFT_1148715 [Mycena rosella]